MEPRLKERLLEKTLHVWKVLYAEALNTVHNSDGYSRISALRVTAEIVRQQAEYQVTVGWVANRRCDPNGTRGPTWEEVSESVSQEDLEDLFITVGDDFKARRMKAAGARTIPALPLATEAAN